jgi:hypothetical protein
VNGGLAIDDFSTLSLRRSQGTGAYAIHFANVGPRHPLRFVGSSDSTTHRYFEFGHYSGESQAGAWNGRVFINSYTGALGVGEPSSLYQFSVNSGSNSYSARIRSAGDFVFALAGDGIAGTNVDLFSIRNNNTVAVHLNAVNGARLALGVSTSTGAGGTAEALTITSQGNIGIGAISPTHKLSVNGTVRAKEVIVETAGWADYVFADDYALKPLAEVEAHIKQHKHLPGIPSAKEVAEEGVSVGEMQAKLLAKIEELTLHVIAQQKEAAAQFKAQHERILTLERENALLRSGL